MTLNECVSHALSAPAHAPERVACRAEIAASTANRSGRWQCGPRVAAAMSMWRQRSALVLSGLGRGSVERARGERALASAFRVSVGGGSVPMEVAVGDDIE